MKTDQNSLTALFQDLFGGNAEWHVRAPGRVNLIGDHTDYNNLPVFPMALQRSIAIVGRTRRDNRVRVINVDNDFEQVEFELTADVGRGPIGSWGNYVKAAPVALVREQGAVRGFDALVASDIPVAAGLSSSSALVVACGLATCLANAISLPLTVLAELMARAERFVGTQGGGMDQAVCLGGQQGCAVRIDFAPLRLDLVDVPPDWQFVVAHSLVRAEKSGAAQQEYNVRTADCKRALVQIKHAIGGLPDRVADDFPEVLAVNGAENVLRMADRELAGVLRKRFRHTVSEALRVEQAVSAMRSHDRAAFGRLMTESHASLRDDYEVSVPVLDELVEVLIAAGCDGARLTGAGFGGCAVGLCATDRAQVVRDSVIDRFYSRRIGNETIDDLIFLAQPSAGADCHMLDN